MLIFADSTDLTSISQLHDISLIHGVTTNPSILSRNGLSAESAIQQLVKVTSGQIHVQVVANDVEDVLQQAQYLYSLSNQVVIKLSIAEHYLRACNQLNMLNIPVNMTLCFSPLQALIAAKAGATFVSVFIGRLDDTGICGLDVLSECCEIWQNYPDISTKLLAASIRNQHHVLECAKMGVDAVTAHPKIICSMFHHNLTTQGIQSFDLDLIASAEKIKT